MKCWYKVKIIKGIFTRWLWLGICLLILKRVLHFCGSLFYIAIKLIHFKQKISLILPIFLFISGYFDFSFNFWFNIWSEIWRRSLGTPISPSRSTCQEVFCKKGVLRNFAKIHRKTLVPEFLFNKVAGLRPHLVAAFDHLKCIAALALTIQQHFTLKIPSLPILDFLEA